MAPKRDGSPKLKQPALIPKFEPEEEAALLCESNEQKAQANKLFASSRYSEAIGEYDKALSSCPNYLEYEIAVLRSNIAACHLKLEDWKAAVDAATASLDALDRLQPKTQEEKPGAGDAEVVEIQGEGAEAEQQLETLKTSDERKADVQRIRAKALMRRAKARSEQGGWGSLQGAEEDYRELATVAMLPLRDQKTVQTALAGLPARINAAKEREMGEMMGKLKELGNGILRPFGLSTDNFNMVKDEATGGYSMNFNQGQ
ncbi:Tetratricopeptide-like helical domain [Lasallia pustulata]|uniref:Tetratricopeptide-like helical domain n=1 Tax=Lasallia pustulata TaxID=136370 RepID=A0A1W5DAM5_9LECA|nr:Tetratricopeptide-like helical domain [Lasallia pustulata]